MVVKGSRFSGFELFMILCGAGILECRCWDISIVDFRVFVEGRFKDKMIVFG